jgi:amidase
VLIDIQLNNRQAEWRYQFAETWHNTRSKTSTDRPIDCLICPCAPSAGFPHGFPVWWGYFSLWNLTDYPSIILPLKKMRVDAEKDAKDTAFVPKDNVFDRMNWEICKFVFEGKRIVIVLLLTTAACTDDPELWKNQPITIQLVGPQFSDEELIAVSEVVDQVCNG